MNPILLAKLTKEGLQALTRKETPSLRRRARRIADKGLTTPAVDQALSLKAPKPTAPRNEWLSYAAKVSKLNQNPATRMEGARESYERYARRKANDERVKMTLQNNRLSKMSDQEIIENSRVIRARMRGRIASIEAEFGETASTMRAKEILADMRKAKSRQARMSAAYRGAMSLEGWSTFDKAGARLQHQRGIALLGNHYGSLTAAQQTAVWEAVHKHAAVHSLHSEEAVAVHRDLLERAGQTGIGVTFSERNGTLEAHFGATLTQAEATKIREDARARALARIQSKSTPDPLGPFVRRPKF